MGLFDIGKKLVGGGETYSPQEYDAITNHVRHVFGDFSLLTKYEIKGTAVDILLIKPSKRYDCYILATCGLGAHKIRIPQKSLNPNYSCTNCDRVELVMCLESDWDLGSSVQAPGAWPVRALENLIRYGLEKGVAVAHGQIFPSNDPNSAPYTDNTVCVSWWLSPDEQVTQLPTGDYVVFNTVIPLLSDDRDLIATEGYDALLNDFEGDDPIVYREPDMDEDSAPRTFGANFGQERDDYASDNNEGNSTWGPDDFVQDRGDEEYFERQERYSHQDDDDDEESYARDDFDGILDKGEHHIQSILDKKMNLDPINAYNHMAVYLRFMITHELVSNDFMERYAPLVSEVIEQESGESLREFIRDELEGLLRVELFNHAGQQFSLYYYAGNPAPDYLYDIDIYARERLGDDCFDNSKYFGEPYLFIPYNNDYYFDLEAMLEERLDSTQDPRGLFTPDEDEEEIMEQMKGIFLLEDDDTLFITSSEDDEPVAIAYKYAEFDSEVEQEMVPCLVEVTEELVVNCVTKIFFEQGVKARGADILANLSKYQDHIKSVHERTIKEVESRIGDAPAILERLLNNRIQALEENDFTFDEVQGNFSQALFEREEIPEEDRIVGQYDFDCYWTEDEVEPTTVPLMLGKFKFKHHYEILAACPFGPFGACPDNMDLMIIAAYFEKEYGAKLAVITENALEFTLKEPLSKERAQKAAQELYAFCPQSLTQTTAENETIAALAAYLTMAQIWTCPFSEEEEDFYGSADDYDGGFERHEDGGFIVS